MTVNTVNLTSTYSAYYKWGDYPEIEKAIESEELYNQHIKFQDNALVIESVNTSDLSKIKNNIQATLNSHPEITELQVKSCVLSNYIINNISKFLRLNPNINSLHFDHCKIYKYSADTLNELIGSNNSLSHFQSLKGHSDLRSPPLFSDSILKNNFLTHVELSSYGLINIKDFIPTSKAPIAKHIISNQTLVHILANSLYSKFGATNPASQKLDGGVLYFYQRSDKNLLKCYIIEIIKAKALQAVIDNPESSAESRVNAAKDLMNVLKIKLSHGNYGYSPQILAAKVLAENNADYQSFEKDAASIMLKVNNYIADNYFQLRAVFKNPNAVMNFARVVEVPKFVLDHISSYLGVSSLWQGDPKILPGRIIQTDNNTVYSIHECDRHYAYSVSQWGLDDKFNLAVAKPVITKINHTSSILSSADNSSSQNNFDEDHEIMETDGQFDLYDSLFGQEEVDLMGWYGQN